MYFSPYYEFVAGEVVVGAVSVYLVVAVDSRTMPIMPFVDNRSFEFDEFEFDWAVVRSHCCTYWARRTNAAHRPGDLDPFIV